MEEGQVGDDPHQLKGGESSGGHGIERKTLPIAGTRGASLELGEPQDRLQDATSLRVARMAKAAKTVRNRVGGTCGSSGRASTETGFGLWEHASEGSVDGGAKQEEICGRRLASSRAM